VLLDRDVLVVTQKTKLFELRNQYTLGDLSGERVGSVEQVGQSPLTVLARVFSDLDIALPVRLEVRDAAGALVLTIAKPWLRLRADVSGGASGSVVKRIRLGKARFELLAAGGEMVGEVRADNWRAKDFTVLDAGGQRVARVTKQWSGLARELFTDADTYVIDLGIATEPLRSLTLAAALAVDLLLKQKDT
jgi:uncharacterized protein YxjI